MSRYTKGNGKNQRMIADTGMKRCPRCTAIKTVANFNRDRFSADGYRTYCKECRNDIAREDWALKKPYVQRKIIREMPNSLDETIRRCEQRLKALKMLKGSYEKETNKDKTQETC